MLLVACLHYRALSINFPSGRATAVRRFQSDGSMQLVASFLYYIKICGDDVLHVPRDINQSINHEFLEWLKYLKHC